MNNTMLGNNRGEGELHYTLEKVSRVLNGECEIKVGNSPPRYTNDMNNLFISKEAAERYNEEEIKCQLSALQIYVWDSINSYRDDDLKSFKKSFRLSRGIVNKLGIKTKKVNHHFKFAPPELLKSLEAHQDFTEAVGQLYDEMVIQTGVMPLMKRRKYNGRQSFIESGAEIAEKLMNHIHRTGLDIAKYGLPEEDTEEY